MEIELRPRRPAPVEAAVRGLLEPSHRCDPWWLEGLRREALGEPPGEEAAGASAPAPSCSLPPASG